MGYAMAKNVRKHMDVKATLYVNDVNVDACHRFKEEFSPLGPVEIVQSAKEIADNALTILSIVPTGKHVKDVYLNESTGIAAARRVDPTRDSRRLYLECSTIDILTAQEVGSELERCGLGTYIDCPVSGGVPAADQGQLSLLLGRSPPTPGDVEHEQLERRIQKVCEYIGAVDKIFYCGQRGNGLAAKICNNYLSCTILLANCEAMATGMKLGLDKHVLHKIIHSSTGQNFMADHVCPIPGVVPHAPSSNDYRLGFKAQMLVKDVGLGVDAAKSVNIKPSIGEAAMQVYDKVAIDEGCIVSGVTFFFFFLLPAARCADTRVTGQGRVNSLQVHRRSDRVRRFRCLVSAHRANRYSILKESFLTLLDEGIWNCLRSSERLAREKVCEYLHQIIQGQVHVFLLGEDEDEGVPFDGLWRRRLAGEGSLSVCINCRAMLSLVECFPRCLAVHESDDIRSQSYCICSLSFIETCVVVLEEEGRVQDMACIALEVPGPRVGFVEAEHIRRARKVRSKLNGGRKEAYVVCEVQDRLQLRIVVH